MSLSDFVSNLEQKAKNIQDAIQQSISNHNGLLGMLKAVQECIEDANKIVSVIAPDSSLDKGLDMAEDVVKEANATLESLGENNG